MSGNNAVERARPVSVRVRLRSKAQVTLPEEIRHALLVGEGDEVEFTVRRDGTVTVRGYVSIPSDQAWRYGSQLGPGRAIADDPVAGQEPIPD